jgi:hypothetical protein
MAEGLNATVFFGINQDEDRKPTADVTEMSRNSGAFLNETDAAGRILLRPGER